MGATQSKHLSHGGNVARARSAVSSDGLERRIDPATGDKRIAVLPFENLSEQKEHGAFADGVQDDILDQAGEDRRPESHQPDKRDGIPRQTKSPSDRK